MIDLFLNVVAPVVIIAGLGWGWSRLKLKFDSETIALLVTNIGAPSLVFSTLSSLTISNESLGQLGLAAVVTIAVSALVAAVVLRVVRMPVSGFLPPMIFGNTGNMGLPVCFFAFGEKGLTLAIVVFSAYAIATLVIGQWIYSGDRSPVALFKTPIVYAVGLALIFLIIGQRPPEVILKTTRLLGQFTIPVMLFTLGISLASLNIDSLLRAVLTSSLRLGLGFGVGVLIAELFGLTGIARGVLILESSMPVAVFNFLLAKRYERNSKEVAELVFISTLMSVITLPFVLKFVT